MEVAFIIKTGVYYDSITLMNIQKELAQDKDVEEAGVVMASESNRAILQMAGLWKNEMAQAKSEDLIISVRATAPEKASEALALAEKLLKKDRKASGTSESDYFPKSFDSALKIMPDANVLFVSLPGRYASEEAMKALDNGLHVMLFSDNVPIEHELELKRKSSEKGLLVMGPDCGTAIINGVGLGFANSVRRGPIGVVGASGTGIQEVTCLVHNYGKGISHAIGTGGRDLSPQVGGSTMLQGLDALAKDPKTRVIVLISKPPAPEVAEKLLQKAETCGKPVVVNFIGGDFSSHDNLVFARTLEEAARHAVSLARNQSFSEVHAFDEGRWQSVIAEEKKRRSSSQKYLRGLYSGGTLAYEALFLLKPGMSELHSNLSKDPEYKLHDPTQSVKHSIIDLGEDEYTVGRPHPMIDHGFRARRLVQEACDPETAVILFDLVLGYGSHPKPLDELLPAIGKAQQEAKQRGGHVSVVAYITGTDQDPQDKEEIVAQLQKNGVLVASSNGEAAHLASRLTKV